MEITISGKDRNHLKQVEDLAKKLGLDISSKKGSGTASREKNGKTREAKKETSEKLYQLMTEMAESGAFKSIKDPVAWQREQRKDRPLPGREE